MPTRISPCRLGLEGKLVILARPAKLSFAKCPFSSTPTLSPSRTRTQVLQNEIHRLYHLYTSIATPHHPRDVLPMIAIYTAHFFNKSGFGVGKINHNYAWECRSVGPKMKKCDFMPGYAFNQLQVDTKAQPSPLVHLNSCLCPYRQPQVIFNRVILIGRDWRFPGMVRCVTK